MAFHISNFGSFASDLKHYADINGYVPEEGDSPEDLNWGHDEFERDFDDYGDGYDGYAAEKWSEHVSGAVAATEKASVALAEWRAGN